MIRVFSITEAKPEGDDHFRRDAFVLRQPVQGVAMHRATGGQEGFIWGGIRCEPRDLDRIGVRRHHCPAYSYTLIFR